MQLHASCVAVNGQGVLIIGPSGSGKSSVALGLIALGATLVADDQVKISIGEGWPVAKAPKTTQGLIEARGIGILTADTLKTARITLMIDMGQVEVARLPPDRTYDLAGFRLPLLHKVDSPMFPAGIRQYLLGGKAAR